MTKFGVEIECEISRSDAVAAIRNIEGIRALNRMCGYHQNRDFSMWRVEHDGSVHNGCEIVSPILDTETDGFEQIKKVCHALTAAGARINMSCGLHVHIGIQNLTISWLKNIMKRYADNTSTIDSFMPRSRRSNGRQSSYCTAMTRVVATPHFNNSSTLRSLISCCARFYAVNITNYYRLGTIEFRQHSGTLNAEKIRNWVRLLSSFIEASRPSTGRASRTTATNDGTVRIRGSKRRILIEALTGSNFNQYMRVHDLCQLTGFRETSLRSTISQLRQLGYQFIYNRPRRSFCCVGTPALSESNRQTTPSRARNEPPRRSMSLETAHLWTGVPEDVQAYYVERINDLA